MSVTFSIEALSTGVFTAACYASGESIEAFRVDGYEAAKAALVAHKAECSECECYGCYINAVLDVEGGEVNVANANARHLGVVLGFDFGDELCGSADPSVLLGHVLPAMAFGREPVAAHETKIPGRATFIDCGFDADDYLARLADLCVEAERLGRKVVWS